jgi:hypothetical protein
MERTMHPIPALRGPYRLGELVNKIETSATTLKKRLRTARKKIKKVTREHRRIAKTRGLYAAAVTLTYAKDADFCPKHVTRFINCLRAKLKRQGHALLYVWFLERESALHYHLAVWLPRGFALSHADLAKWWPWGSTWTERCRKVSAWIHYISKRECKANLPVSARAYGYGGLDEPAKDAVQKAMLPRWLKALLPVTANVRRLPRVGWTDMDTGEVYESPWVWTPRGPRLKSSRKGTEI